MSPKEVIPWEDLTPSAKEALIALAKLFQDGQPYEVKIQISQGGARRTSITLDPDTLESIRNKGT